MSVSISELLLTFWKTWESQRRKRPNFGKKLINYEKKEEKTEFHKKSTDKTDILRI